MLKMNLMTGAITILGLFVFASLSLACGGGYGPRGFSSRANLSGEQGQQLAAVNAKYAQQLATLQEDLAEKSRAYKAARANENTTVGTLNELEAELSNLERRYGAVLAQADAEAGKVLPDAYGPRFAGIYSGCGHHYQRDTPAPGRHRGAGYRQDMGGRYLSACWPW
jgi:hypothetical protein